MPSNIPALQASYPGAAGAMANMPTNNIPTSMPNMMGNNAAPMPNSYPGAATGALTGSSASYRMADTSSIPGAQPSNLPPAGAFPGSSMPMANGTAMSGVNGTGLPTGMPPGSTAIPAGYRPGSTRESTYDFSRSANGAAPAAGVSNGIPPMPSVGTPLPPGAQFPSGTQFPPASQPPSNFPATSTNGLPNFNAGSITR